MGYESGHLAGQAVGVVALRCWGRFELIDPRGRKTRAIVAYLALHPDRAVSRQRLMGLLWGDRAEPQARSSMRQAIFELRDLCTRGLISVCRDSVRLHGEFLETDLDRIAAALSSGAGTAVDLPDPDEQLFDDLDGLGEAFDDWLIVERGRQRDLLERALADVSPQAAPRADPPPAVLAVAGTRPRRWRARPLILAGMLAVAAPLAALMIRPEPPPPAAPQDELLKFANAQIMSRRGEQLASAERLSRRAIALAPNDARAWASLAETLAIGQGEGPRLDAARRAARHAIALDPRAGLPHGVLGMTLGFSSEEARGEIRRAARLAPRDPQVLFWLSNIEANAGAYQRQLDHLRTAIDVAPSWALALGQAARVAMQLGYRQEAQGYLARLMQIDQGACFALLFNGSRERADYAAIVRQIKAMRVVGNVDSDNDRMLGFALLAVGDRQRAQLLLALPDADWRIANGEAASPATLAQLNREALNDPLAESLFLSALTNAIGAGRAVDVARIYDSHQGVMAKLADRSNFADLAEFGVNAAMALRAVGRAAEAAALLDRLDQGLRHRREIGPLPIALLATGAQLSAARGDVAGALTQLETAVLAGWRYAPDQVTPDIAAIPAFVALRGQARFEKLRHQLAGERARHAAEIAKII